MRNSKPTSTLLLLGVAGILTGIAFKLNHLMGAETVFNLGALVLMIGLLSTMLFAMVFHFLDTGLQGAPFAIVEAHNYEFETSALYFFIFLVLAIAGSGSLSLSSIYRNRFPQLIQGWV